ncbi:MAG TPA: ABC-2 family transporter protein [Opitutaceae bacterium]|nr:ABC-2 family transporter protein [Opitutaceae bacterium]HPG16234.1 ABC-2 family transporter protein [Opitutaceae bacterium]HPO01356.1 ABC-2 family transporter protein [Opitutaceae bacterium]
MRTAFHKYRHVFLVGVQSNLVYRWNFAIRATFSLFHLIAAVTLWRAAFAGQTDIGGFSLAETLTYFVTLMVLQFFIGAFNEDYQVSEEIRNGLINQFLLKPVNYFAYRFTLFVSARTISGLLVLVPLALAMPFLHEYLTLPSDPWRLWMGLPALAMSAVIQFGIAFCFGLLSFWFLEIQSFVILSFAVETVLGGQVFPLDLLPAGLFRISQFLPYYYQMYFPAAILTGRIATPAEAAVGLGIQACWVVALLGLIHVLWTRGLRRHTAVGG